MIGLIRVVTQEEEESINAHGDIISEKYGLAVRSACISDQPNGIYDKSSESVALPKIIELGKKLVNDGCNSLLISCAADPGVAQLRESVSVPVIGAGSSASFLAKASGKKTGVIGITDDVPPIVKEILGDALVQYVKPAGIENTNSLVTDAGKKACLEAVELLLTKGVTQIQFACTGMATIKLGDYLKSKVEVSIIDAVDAEGCIANFYLK